MPLQQLDVIVRVAGATLLLLAAVSPRPSRRTFIPLAICLCGFLAGNSADPSLRLAGVLVHPQQRRRPGRSAGVARRRVRR